MGAAVGAAWPAAALERVENLTVSSRLRLAVETAPREGPPPRHSDAWRRGGRRVGEGDLIFRASVNSSKPLLLQGRGRVLGVQY